MFFSDVIQKNENTYSLLGEFGDNRGKNCATAVYFSLVASGIGILTASGSPKNLISEVTGFKAIIPQNLAKIVKQAALVERQNAETDVAYLDFESQVAREQEEVLKIIAGLYQLPR